jgi:predicted nucleic acid-binding protein
MARRPVANVVPGEACPGAVLDTQVVLDWLVFRDPACFALAQALGSGKLRWLISAPMHAELNHVLDRGVAAAWLPDRAAIGATIARFAVWLEPGKALGGRWRCTDPDDQMFIDLAVGAGAQWLFTRDRALLRLAKLARTQGVSVLRPGDWTDSAPPISSTQRL